MNGYGNKSIVLITFINEKRTTIRMETLQRLEGLVLFAQFANAASVYHQFAQLMAQDLQPCQAILDLNFANPRLASHLLQQGKHVYAMDVPFLKPVYSGLLEQSEGRLHLLQPDDDPPYEHVQGVCGVGVAAYGTDEFLTEVSVLQDPAYLALGGMETSKRQKCAFLLGQEMQLKRRRGLIQFSQADIERLCEWIAEEMPESMEYRDSSREAVAALKRHGFDVRRQESLYHDTHYYVLAQRS
jgi:hypothetical protein